MTGLSTADYHDHAAARVAEAWQTIAAHSTQAYTGICVVCGRPGPCDEQRAARRKLARYAGTGPSPEDAVQSVAESLDDLRTAWATIIVASDRAGAQAHGSGLTRRLAPWQGALTECWQALGLVYSGLTEARRDPATPGGSAGELLAGLHAARADADRAAALAAAVRLRLIVAEDRLRRTGSPAGLLAARRWGAAVRRLDLVAARLAVGSRAIQRYADSLAGVSEPAPPRPPSRCTAPAEEIALGVRAACRLVTARRRRVRPGFWRTVRQRVREEFAW
ncbi:hypothetical protein V6U90_07875 [Micromonospora sp. CPCC 206060]|uniref:hypothetical protein n=1 Tax=Micromonospora sp. CPCC 206060 TaxID=3122406 RepID=UPI002FF05424